MITISPAANQEVNRLKSKQKEIDRTLYLRLGVQLAGCCGLSYTLDFADTVQPEDLVYEGEIINIIVDPKWLIFLEGLQIDYAEDLMGGGFRFHNPNATQNCSCGNSFTVATSVTVI